MLDEVDGAGFAEEADLLGAAGKLGTQDLDGGLPTDQLVAGMVTIPIPPRRADV